MHTCKAIRYRRVRGFVIVVYFIAYGYHGLKSLCQAKQGVRSSSLTQNRKSLYRNDPFLVVPYVSSLLFLRQIKCNSHCQKSLIFIP